MHEEWKDINGYEGKYQISNLGNVRSLNWRNTGSIKNLYLKPQNEGYLKIELADNGETRTFLVHRLVATHFVPGYKEGFVVNHLNEIKTDNRVENLEWCSLRDNVRYGTAIKRSSERHKKPIEQIDKHGRVVRVWVGAIDAETQGFNRKTISACCVGKVKFHKGYMWRYAT